MYDPNEDRNDIPENTGSPEGAGDRNDNTPKDISEVDTSEVAKSAAETPADSGDARIPGGDDRFAGTGEAPVNSVTGSGEPETGSGEQRRTLSGKDSWYDSDERNTEREPYSDAGYVSSEDASAVPPRYHCAAPSQKERKPRGARHAGKMAGVVAMCLVCAILGGLCGGAIIGKSLKSSGASASSGSSTVLNVATTPATSNVTTNVVQSGSELTSSQIYTLACSQVVGITTDVTYTNIFGQTSSGAVSGSGFIISADGYILTNYHVISDAVEGGYAVKVYLYDGTEYTATIVGYEQDNDVAVLKIDATGLNPVTLGDSDSMAVGETVYAVGNPLGELEYTMTSGMVSALDRDITSTDETTGAATTINMFQIDAAINSGNSGGPVYNSRGEVIGIVTAKYSSTGVEGLGFAIPINDAVSIANDLITNGYVTGKPYMGITVQTVSSTVAQYYNMKEGAYVYSIESGSCAEKAGLQVGDIIVGVDDKEVTSSSDLTAAEKTYKAGDTATLKVYRSGNYVELSITFDEKTPTTTSSSSSSSSGSGNSSQGGTQQYGYGSLPFGQSQFGGSGQQNP